MISWRQAVLQKQIDYGAKLGHVVLSLAKMELENFFKNVMPVADYFDQSDMLMAVSTWFYLFYYNNTLMHFTLDIINNISCMRR